MSTQSSNFVIGSDDEEQLDKDLDYKHDTYQNVSDSRPTKSENKTNTNTNTKKTKPQNKDTTNLSQHQSYQNTTSQQSNQYTPTPPAHLPNGPRSTNNEEDDDDLSFTEYTEEFKPIHEIIDTTEFYKFQKICHKIIYPLIWLCDHRILRRRSWLQLPLIKYTICITSMIIGIALSQLIIKAYEFKAAENGTLDNYNLNDVIYFLSAYVVLISILCTGWLYLYYQYATEHGFYSFKIYRYNYFVMTASGIIGKNITFYF